MLSGRTLSSLVFCVTVSAPGIVFAEVSDKEPAAQLLSGVGLATALLCLLVSRVKPWLGLLFFAPAALWFASLFMEIHSADVRPYLHLEQGSAYYVQAYAAFAVALCGLVMGIIRGWRSSSSRPTPLR